MFQFDEEQDGYVAELNGVAFICDEPQDGLEEEARKLSELYWQKLPEMIDFMLPELQEIYGDLDAAALPEQLGTPTVDLTRFVVMYMNHTLDDEHILQFEYGDDFSSFECFAMDG